MRIEPEEGFILAFKMIFILACFCADEKKNQYLWKKLNLYERGQLHEVLQCVRRDELQCRSDGIGLRCID